MSKLKEIAEQLLQRYQQRKARGELRVDDKLYLELTQIMPEAVAQRIFGEFRIRSGVRQSLAGRHPAARRRALHSNAEEENILLLGDLDKL